MGKYQTYKYILKWGHFTHCWKWCFTSVNRSWLYSQWQYFTLPRKKYHKVDSKQKCELQIVSFFQNCLYKNIQIVISKAPLFLNFRHRCNHSKQEIHIILFIMVFPPFIPVKYPWVNENMLAPFSSYRSNWTSPAGKFHTERSMHTPVFFYTY